MLCCGHKFVVQMYIRVCTPYMLRQVEKVTVTSKSNNSDKVTDIERACSEGFNTEWIHSIEKGNNKIV